MADLSPIVTIFGGMGVAAIGAAGAWIASKQDNSGDIGTSKPEVLWANLLGELTESRKEVALLKAEATAARAESVALREETLKLREEMIALRSDAAEVRLQLKDCLREMKAQTLLNRQLAEQVPK